MPVDLREEMARSYPAAEVRPVAPERLWAKGRRRRRRLVAVAAAAGAALVAVVVGGIGQLLPPLGVPFVADDEEAVPADPLDRVEVEPLPPGMVRGLVATAHPFADPGPDVGGLSLQEEILADLLVTPDEYRRAFDAYVTCLERESLTVQITDGGPFDPAIQPGLMLGVAVSSQPGEPDPTDTMEWCRAQWFWQVERVWERQIRPEPHESERAWERLWQCARAHGAELPAQRSDSPEHELEAARYAESCRPWEALD